MNKEVVLIRHAESEANAGLVSAAPDSIPLTAKGFEQAKLLAESFSFSPTLIIVSGFLRAKQTADPLIKSLPLAEVENWNVHEFTYLSPLRCGHSTMAERKPLVEEFWRRSEIDYCDGDGAESFEEFIGRIRETIENLRNSKHQSILIISHGQFIRGLIWLLLTERKDFDSAAMKEFYNFLEGFPFPNTGYIKIKLNENENYISNINTKHLSSILISY